MRTIGQVEVLQMPSGESSTRCRPEVVARQGRILFSAYRAADYADADGFAVQLAKVLSEFSEEVVVHVTSPLTGIQRTSKWPPTISEVLEACERHQETLWRRKNDPPIRRSLPAPIIDRSPGSLAAVHVSEWHHRYASLCEWAKTAEEKWWKFCNNSKGEPGIKVCNGVWYEGTTWQPLKPSQIGAR